MDVVKSCEGAIAMVPSPLGPEQIRSAWEVEQEAAHCKKFSFASAEARTDEQVVGGYWGNSVHLRRPVVFVA